MPRGGESITRTALLVRMEISYHGDGSPAPADEDEARLGLPGMEDRAGTVGGTFEIKSRPGDETIIIVEIPLTDFFAEVEHKRPPV